MSNPLIIYHAGCADGFCSAFLLWRLYPDAEFLPANHGDAPPDVAGRSVYIVDFSYPRDELVKMHSSASSLIVLDHHKTSEEDLRGLPFCTFDMGKSGARLTWEFVERLTTGTVQAFVPWYVQYVEDRDLWKWVLPHSREVNACLRSYPMTFATWSELCSNDSPFAPLEFIKGGEAILRDQALTVATKVKQSHTVVVHGVTWSVCNATTLISETAGELARSVSGVGCCWFERADGSRTYSLRSIQSEGPDVSAIARVFGGGGHRHAAGFTLSPECRHPWQTGLC